MGNGKVKIGAMTFTASQVGTLYGCGFNSLLDMFNHYQGTSTPNEPNESMEFGTFFEDAVARYASKKLGLGTLIKCGEKAYWADDMPYFICHPDRLVKKKDKQGRRVGLEIKCVSPFASGWGEEGTTEIPDNYYLQVQSYFACGVPVDVVYVCCMKGNRVNIYEILPDEDVIADIRRRVKETKESFDKGIVPKAEGFEDASAYYKSRVDLESDGVGANDNVLTIYEKLKEAHKAKDQAEAEEKKYKAELIELLGSDSAFVVTEDKKIRRICYWSDRKSPSLDQKRLEKDFPNIDFDSYHNINRVFSVNFK